MYYSINIVQRFMVVRFYPYLITVWKSSTLHAWRVAIRKVWRVPWITHCNMLHITGRMSIGLWCAANARCIKFDKMACDSMVVKTIANMGINGSYSIMGGNKRHLDLKFCMNKKKIHDICVKMNVPLCSTNKYGS